MSKSPSSRKNSPSDSARPEDPELLQRAVADFDAAWQSVAKGQSPPRLEAVLNQAPEADRSRYLRKLLAVELDHRTRRGDHVAEGIYLARFPFHIATVKAVFKDFRKSSARQKPPKKASWEPADSADIRVSQAMLAGQKLKAGTTLGNYVILGLIGQGGMGAVYQAEHTRMRRTVALKMIAPEAVRNPDALARFQREVQAVSRLEHPNIVPAYDADHVRGIHFLVMQYVDGDDLSMTVNKLGPLSLEMALRCMIQTARGLEYAHQAGVIHRDIKPANLILAHSGVVKILDMGIARLEQSLSPPQNRNVGLTESGDMMGTIDFMAPEQALDAKTADQRADIYSLGCTLYYLLTGRTLYAGDTMMIRLMAHRSALIPSLCAARRDVPEWLDVLFQKMVAKEPADRFQSMTEVLAALAPNVTPGLASGEFEVPVSARRDLREDHSPRHRSAATPIVAAPGERQPGGRSAETAQQNTSRASNVDTHIKGSSGDRNAHAGKAAPAGNIVPDAPATPDWRTPRAAGDTATRKASTPKPRNQPLGAAAFYLGLTAAVAVAIYVATVMFRPHDVAKPPAKTATGAVQPSNATPPDPE